MIKEKSHTIKSYMANVVMDFTTSILKLKNKLLPAEAVMLDYSVGSFISNYSILIIAKLEIADILSKGPMSIQELAQKTNSDSDALYRVMRALSSKGIFEELKEKRFKNNKLSHTLNSNNENNILGLVNYICSDWNLKQWASFDKCVDNNKCLYRNLYDKRCYEWFEENPNASKLFNEGMINLSAISDKAIASAYKFSRAKSILDIGGGLGGQLATILRCNPTLEGAIFELKAVTDEINTYKLLEDVNNRIQLITGNFFNNAIPEGYDLYFLKSIIHNWEDERAMRILKNIRKSMSKDSKILIAELLITKENKPEFGKLLDVAMLAVTGGVERTNEEYDILFGKCGLKLNRIIKTASPYCILEVLLNDK